MATTTVSIAQKYGLPPFNEKSDFDQWLYELDMWKLVTDLPKASQGPVIFLSLNPKMRQACAGLSKEEINKDDGVDKLVMKLKELYSVSRDQATFSAYEKFETFQRPESMNIIDYINEFKQLNQKLINYKIDLPSAVCAYQLLKNANLPKEKRDLARATIPDLTYESMKKEITDKYDHCATTSENKVDDISDIKIETENTYYGQGYPEGRYNRYRPTQGGWGGRSRGNFHRGSPKEPNTHRNPAGRNGRPTRCHICQFIFHWAIDCPDKAVNKAATNQETVHVQLFAEGVEQCFLEQVVSETLNCALLYTGCSANVCGINWLQCYVDSLPTDADLQETYSSKVFKFGAGDTYQSLKQVNIPVSIAGMDARIQTDVVDCEIPLLLSKGSLKHADTQLDFVNDNITMYGKEINLQHTSDGHYCIPLTPKQLAVTDIQQSSSRPVKVLFTVDDLQNKSPQEKAAMASKLHKQFGHPVNSERLKQLLRDANIQDDDLFKQIDTVTESCDICERYKKARSRPVVSLPLADDFNQCLAMDLKFITINKRSFIILHMTDVFTRFSQAVIISSKHKANAISK